MLYVVSYMCTIVGVYSCAVDANQCVVSEVGTCVSKYGRLANRDDATAKGLPIIESAHGIFVKRLRGRSVNEF